MAVMIIQLFQFIFYIAMSAVVNVPVVLSDVRETNIEILIDAVAYGLKLDALEKNLMHQIFQINIDKLFIVSGNDVKNMNDIQFKYIQCELLLKIGKKLKLMLMSLEEYLCHEAIVNGNFQYDQPQQQVWNEIQNYLNQMQASDALDRVL